MSAITLWLLVSLGSNWHQSARPSVVMERFVDGQECQRVAAVLNQQGRQIHQCIQATIYRP